MDAGDCHGYFCSNLFEFGVGVSLYSSSIGFAYYLEFSKLAYYMAEYYLEIPTTTGIDSVGSGSWLIHQRLTDANRFP